MPAQEKAGSSEADSRSDSVDAAQVRKEEREPTATELTLLRIVWEGAEVGPTLASLELSL